MKLEHLLTPYIKIIQNGLKKKKKPKCKTRNYKKKKKKLLDENIGRTPNDINQSKIFYDSPPRVM